MNEKPQPDEHDAPPPDPSDLRLRIAAFREKRVRTRTRSVMVLLAIITTIALPVILLGFHAPLLRLLMMSVLVLCFIVAMSLGSLVSGKLAGPGGEEGWRHYRPLVRPLSSTVLVAAVVYAWCAWWAGWLWTISGLLLAMLVVVVILPLGVMEHWPLRMKHWGCGACGYEQPERRDEFNERCPECGNFWWADEPRDDGPSDAMYEGVRRVFEPRPNWSVAAGAVSTVVSMFGFFFLLWVTMLRPGILASVVSVLPTPVLLAYASTGDRLVPESVYDEVLLRRNASSSELRAVVSSVTAARDRRRLAPRGLGPPLAAALGAGVLSESDVAPFFSNAVRPRLTATYDATLDSVELEFHVDRLDTTLEVRVFAYLDGVRVAGEPPAWRRDDPVPVEWLAHTYRAWWLRWSAKTEESVWSSHGIPRRFEVSTPLAPGEYTVTLRLQLIAATGSASGVFHHTPWAPDGSFVVPPSAVWHETRDVEATFVVGDASGPAVGSD